MLLIAAPDPDTIATTFIRQHINLIAPEATAVVYFEGDGNSVKSIPSLRINETSESLLTRKVTGVLNILNNGYSGTLRKDQESVVREFIEKNSIRCVLAEFGQIGCTLSGICRKMNLPLFVYFHGHDASSYGKKLINQYAYKQLGAYASKIFVGSKYFKKTVAGVGIPENKIQVVPCGLDTDVFKPGETKRDDTIIAVGRMVDKKAPHLTVEAFSLTLREVPNAKLEMIGDGPLLTRAKETAKMLSIENSVVFHGAKDHNFVRERIASATIFAQHSVTAPNGDTESLGISLLEAMACEVPVVSTRHNGFVETVEDGVTGYLVDEHDVQGMSLKMIKLLQDAEHRKEMGRAGRQRVLDHFDSKCQSQQMRIQMGL
ncbi:MAG: glycosyltransferase [Opitutaceae bacterium]